MAENITSAKATAKMVRVAPRKARLVLDAIRGKSVAEAFAILKFTSRGAASDVEKVLNSAVANAENNFDLDRASLVVSEAYANEGLPSKTCFITCNLGLSGITTRFRKGCTAKALSSNSSEQWGKEQTDQPPTYSHSIDR